MTRLLYTATALLVVEALLGAVFSHLTRVEGLVTPHGSPNADAILIGALYLGIRAVVRLALPAMLVPVAAPHVVAQGRRLLAKLPGARASTRG